MVDNRRVRISLKTRDLQRAARRLREIEDRVSGKPRKTVIDAVNAFRTQHEDQGTETKRRHKRVLGYFTDFCALNALTYLDQMGVEALDGFALMRKHLRAWIKDVELLCQFFRFCQDRGWMVGNPAKFLKVPKIEAKEVVPYTRNEIVKIIAACEKFGRTSYERRRAQRDGACYAVRRPADQ